jgi:hypothetical protein
MPRAQERRSGPHPIRPVAEERAAEGSTWMSAFGSEADGFEICPSRLSLQQKPISKT